MLQIDVEAHGGSVTLVTRPGIIVDTDDLEIRRSNVKVLALRQEPSLQALPPSRL